MLHLNQRIFAVCAFLLALCLALYSSACHAEHARPEQEIQELMMSIWSQPANPLVVEPIVIVEEHALAGWIQGERGGLALLQRHKGQWRVTVCGSDAIGAVDSLLLSGISPEQAQDLSQGFAHAAQQVPPAQRALFSTFGEAIHLDGDHHE